MHSLSSLIAADLDVLQSPAVMRALGVQLLLFGNFAPTGRGWQRRPLPLASLDERVDRIAPTWKSGGRVEYAWPVAAQPQQTEAALSLFDAAAAPALADAGASVGGLVRVLEDIGLRASDFDEAARAALVEMTTWRLPADTDTLQLNGSADLTLLVLSFDATRACVAVDDCPTPGPSNELLAATAEQFVRSRWREHRQRVDVIAQWEARPTLPVSCRPPPASSHPPAASCHTLSASCRTLSASCRTLAPPSFMPMPHPSCCCCCCCCCCRTCLESVRRVHVLAVRACMHSCEARACCEPRACVLAMRHVRACLL
jgi:hypothetical protein